LKKKFYDPWHQVAPEFSREDVNAFVTAFRLYDIDGNGSIDMEELAIALKNMGQGCSPQQLKAFIDEFDTEGNGTIDWSGFLLMMKKFYPEKMAASSDSSTSASKTESKKPVATPPPSKIVTTTATPAKSTTAIPAKSTVSTPAKSTVAIPAKSAAVSPSKLTSSTPKAEIISQQPPVPKLVSTKSASQLISPASGVVKGSSSCSACGKTVYPIEEVRAVDKAWHKGCFKCEGEGCNVTLNLKNFKASGGKVYCVKHVPVVKPTAVHDSLAMKNASNAPKVNKAPGIQKNVRMTFNADDE